MTTRPVPATLRTAARRLGRLRWITKFRVVRRYDAWRPGSRWAAARFVLTDPEVDNFTYELANEDELVAFVAAMLEVDTATVGGYVAELRGDDALASELAARVGRRLDAKRRPPYARRLAWYAVVRATRPRLVVEAGTKDGLGAAVMLRALERNAAEGAPGRLVSFDPWPGAGWLVPRRLAERWEQLHEPTTTALEPALAGRSVDVFIHDSEPTYECELFEITVALAHAGERLVVLTNGDWSTALRDVCSGSAGRYGRFRERPRDHIYPGAAIDVGVFEHGG